MSYCNGLGCDVGFGGDKVKKEDCLGIDFKKPYAHVGEDKVDIPCDLSKDSIPVEDNYFDYVYSSHLIEDFEDTGRVLWDFIRITKGGGNVILVFPDQPKYEAVCNQTGQPLNQYHVHKNMGFNFMNNCLIELAKVNSFKFEILFSSDCQIDYNVVMVIKISK